MVILPMSPTTTASSTIYPTSNTKPSTTSTASPSTTLTIPSPHSISSPSYITHCTVSNTDLIAFFPQNLFLLH